MRQRGFRRPLHPGTRTEARCSLPRLRPQTRRRPEGVRLSGGVSHEGTEGSVQQLQTGPSEHTRRHAFRHDPTGNEPRDVGSDSDDAAETLPDPCTPSHVSATAQENVSGPNAWPSSPSFQYADPTPAAGSAPGTPAAGYDAPMILAQVLGSMSCNPPSTCTRGRSSQNKIATHLGTRKNRN